ncbi:hypothetical protein LOTGIDRAFT_217097 [Lottia gigantea]|uniref:BHLH domain-containing protein n=1 Tax=Lottia gigantea TaxID=225164 RepID=V4AF32_LOTGI|nr:hypothetical protein LOTGIDRAFT_217097 [Lottia gigantea]ESO91936.1 hypothetical protein LOTGIDRAFT_217097 [Lottia gigantea]
MAEGYTDAFEALEGSDLKLETSPSASNSGRFSFSRTNSTGSNPAGCASSASSAHNTDDEDSDKPAMSYKDKRREAHTVAEQKRRDNIKKGYDELQNIVPTCHQSDGLGSQKMSKANVLQRSIEYMQYLVKQKTKQEEQLDSLRKEVLALKTMKKTYEEIVKTHQNTPELGQNQVSDEVKFQVFRQVMDALFMSFDANISVSNFEELTVSVVSWVERFCKPKNIQDLVLGILRQLNSTLNQ